MAGRLQRIWAALKRPPVSLSLGATLIIGAVAAWAAWGSFVFVIHETSTNQFCSTACHEMNIVAAEYAQSVHAHNATGVTATCSHCHIPQHSMVAKVIRKTQAGWTDVVGKISGVISTPEKFEAHRKEMAEAVWASMRKNDSRECRYCHDRAAMDPEQQGKMARRQHEKAVKEGMTCIDCHQGIAHKLPPEPEEATEAPAGQAPDAAAQPPADESAAAPAPPQT
ncbi:MAG TPA: NapC/NirT family cytochrome c [Povalibacter sp.]